jgi:DNA-binding GntR family transcriptional regulator
VIPTAGTRQQGLSGRNASAEAARLIREGIVGGRLRPGQRLKEEHLAAELGLSRTPVREALVLLSAEGLLDMQPNRGATVRHYTPEEIRDVYGLRAVLEGYAARLAAQRVTPERVEALEESCDRFEVLCRGEDVPALIAENGLFHDAILDSAGVDQLVGMVRSVVELPLVYKSFLWYSPEQRQMSTHYHRQILKGLRARDSERAELAMKEHVFEARDFLVVKLEEAGAGEPVEERLLPPIDRELPA